MGHIPIPDPYKIKPRPYSVKDSLPRQTIIICGGDGGNMSYLIWYAYNLFIRDFNVLTFDWRGFGQSDTWKMDPDMLCYTEFLIDYKAAIDYVMAEPNVDTTAIGVFGFSTGAYLSFAAADLY